MDVEAGTRSVFCAQCSFQSLLFFDFVPSYHSLLLPVFVVKANSYIDDFKFAITSVMESYGCGRLKI